MDQHLTIKTQPAVEPVSKAEVKLALRIDSTYSTEDDLLDSYIATARQTLEIWTNRTFIFTTYIYYLDYNPGGRDSGVIYLPNAPLSTVTSVKYLDSAGSEQTVAGTVYQADTAATPGRIYLKYGQSWPTSRDIQKQYYIEYVSGRADAAAVAAADEWVKMIIKWMVGHFWINREATSTLTLKDLPYGLQALVWTNKVAIFT